MIVVHCHAGGRADGRAGRALGQGSSDKHELLLNNCSDNKRRADGRVFSANAVAGAAGYAGADGTSIAPL